jgi:hypothetical protein
MPLAALSALTWYGPGCSAMVAVAPDVGASNARLSGRSRASGLLSGTSAVVNAKATRLVSSPAVLSGESAMVRALPKASGRLGAVISVGELTQDDVTGAVLEASVEGGLTVKAVLRVLLAFAAGRTDIDTGGPSPVVRFRSQDNTRDRIAGTMSGSERTAVTIDPL